MAKFVSLDMIQKDFDAAMASVGYVRIQTMCDKWGVTPSKYASLVRKGLIKEDAFMVHSVKYISDKTVFPKED